MNLSPESSSNPSADAQIARFRAALRAADAQGENADPARMRRVTQELSRASDPLIAELSPILLRYCTFLTRRAKQGGMLDGDDLAQEAWSRALLYLRGEKGDRIQSDTHFKNLLFRCAETRMVDLGRRRGVATTEDAFTDAERTDTRTEQAPAPRVLPDVLRRAEQSDWAKWLDVLFSGTALEFREACRSPVRRRPVVYQAFVLITLAGFLRVLQAESGARGESGSALLRELARYLPIPARFWEIAETVARNAVPPVSDNGDDRAKPDAGVNESVIQAVCADLDAPNISRATFHVLRNEARTLAIGKGEASLPSSNRQTSEKS